jgi:flagellar biosynthesis/type III secretory pathway protein FliH
MTFRYTVGSTNRETNRYGADVMRQAVNNGYQQGFKAGRADRRDHWSSNYQQSYGYQDANFGFRGNYLPQSDYNYYFREGFRRGYEDGFARHSQYGTVVNGSPSILGTILVGILGLHNIG